MASRGARLAIGITAGVLALVVLIVLGLAGWALFRPLLSGDYNHTAGDIGTVEDLNSIALEPMVKTVGAPVSVQQAGQLDNRITNTISQIETIRESVRAAQGSRAGTKDDDLAAKLAALDDAYGTLADTFSAWQGEGYDDIGWALHECRNSNATAQACTGAAADLPTPQSAELSALAAAIQAFADSDREVTDAQVLDSAQTDFASAVDALWQAVTTSLDEVNTYLAQHTS